MAEYYCYCSCCGEKTKPQDASCYKCGRSLIIRETNVMSLKEFKEQKNVEISSKFKTFATTTKSSTKSSSSATSDDVATSSSSLKHSVTVNVGIMHRDKHGDLKVIHGKKLPVKVDSNSDYVNLKCTSIEKHTKHNQNFCGIESYVLLYQDGKDAMFLSGCTKSFKLNLYKEELGKPCSQINFYLCISHDFEAAGGENNLLDGPKLSIPGLVENLKLDDFLDSLMIFWTNH